MYRNITQQRGNINERRINKRTSIIKNHVDFGDNERLRLGAGNDLQIYHTGTHSYVQDAGQGNLIINGSNLRLEDNDGDPYAFFTAGGAGEFYHNASKKFETTSSGAAVTGDLTVTGDLNITGDVNSASVTDLDVVDKTITLGKGQVESASGGSGIVVDGSSASILWDETNSTWDFNNAIDVQLIRADTLNNRANSANIIYRTSTNTIVGNNASALVVQDGGKIGMGTASPSAFLTLTGSEASQYAGSFTNTSTQGWGLFVQAGADNDDYSFRIRNKNATDIFAIKSGGLVGIGTTSPSHLLGVGTEGNSSGRKISLYLGGTDGNFAGIGAQRGESNLYCSSEIRFINESNSSGTGAFAIATGGNSLTERMRIDSSGNVGINMNPSGYGKLSVNSTGVILALRASSGAGRLGFYEGGAGRFYLDTMNGADGLKFVDGDGSTVRMTIDASGNVGIGRTPESDIYDLSTISLGNGSMIYASKSGNEPNIDFLDNAFLNSAGVFEYQRSGKSTKVEQYNGTWTFANAPSGTAGQTATFTERMRIGGTGDVTIYGTIGTNSSTAFASMGGRLTFDNDYSDTQRGPNKVVLQNDGAWIAGLGISNNSTDFYSGGNMTFRTGTSLGSERMRIDATGHVGIGSTSTDGRLNIENTTNNFAIFAVNAANNYGTATLCHTYGSGTRYLMDFRVGGTGPSNQVGTITSGGSSTAYNTSSDYRLKENINYTWDAITRLKQLKPARFNFKIDDTNTLVDGFLAHEVSSIVPEAIHGEKDATETYTDDDGNEQTRPVYQGIDQSKLVPLLTKALQEQQTIIEDLKSRIETLEG